LLMPQKFGGDRGTARCVTQSAVLRLVSLKIEDGGAKLKKAVLSVRSHRAAEELATELAARWKSVFEPQSWSERLELLHQAHEQLKEDLRDFEIYCAVSPLLVRELIELLSGGPVKSLAQAHIYANSSDAEHRRAAGEWFAESFAIADGLT
jgi:uroporphyrinogen-III synthase